MFELQSLLVEPKPSRLRESNKLLSHDRDAHDWYRFVLSFPPHLVREYLERFGLGQRQQVLDPFCGTGTTLVECKKMGVPSIGLEANGVAAFASKVKTDWTVNPDALLDHAERVAGITRTRLENGGFEAVEGEIFGNNHSSKKDTLQSLPLDAFKLLLRDSISPVPLHKALVLLDTLAKNFSPEFSEHERIAVAKALVCGASNLKFGPEVGVGPAKKDAPVVDLWLEGVRKIAADLRRLRRHAGIPAKVYETDARQITELIEPNSIDAVITSPPYPNEKDYTRTTRLEAVMLGFLKSKEDLRALKQGLLRSNTRGVYAADEDDRHVSQNREIQRIAAAIEARRIEMGKTSGFERLYARVTKLYFGGMARHLSALRTVLRPGAQLAYVVGDQASYLRIMIRTGKLLAEIAESLGYTVTGIDLFRTRLATATKEQLREEVVLLRWPGR
jgi:tRNA G10  N-methylase Trm11